MVQYATFLTRKVTHQFYPCFEIIYFTEFITLLINLLLSPLLLWITWNAEPLHRNLRYSFMYCISHLIFMNASRIPLLWIQYYSDNIEDHNWLLVLFSFIRFEAFAFYPWIILVITIERFVATQYWSWYEKQEMSTYFIITLNYFIFEVFGIVIAYLILYQDSFPPETVRTARDLIIVAAVGLISIGFVGYAVLLYYNRRELRKLKRRADPNFDRYSLARTYQLRENVVIMKMILKVIVPAFVFASPVFIFRAATFLLPQFELFCSIIIAIFDLWVSLSGLNIQLIFPFVDHRFRKPAHRIPIFRFVIEMRGMQTSSARFVRKHLTGSTVQTADHYFHWLENDLK